MSKKLTKRIFSILTEKEKKERKNSISSRIKKGNVAKSLFFA